MKNNYYFIVNPAAGKGKRLSFISEISDFCRKHEIEYEIVVSKKPGQITELAKKAAQKFNVVVAVGGDGTINEAVNGLVGSPAILGIIPIGSGNDFAYQLGYTRNLKKDLHILKNGRTRKIDLGKLNSDKYFINGFGVGFDGAVARRVNKSSKLSAGFITYFLAVLRTLIMFRMPKVIITLDNEKTIKKKILLISSCNGTTYGGGFNVAPTAKLDDGLFTICLVDKIGRWYALRHLSKFTRGAHTKLPEVHFFTSKNIMIESKRDLVAQYDGEVPALSKKFSAEIIPQAIEIITG